MRKLFVALCALAALLAVPSVAHAAPPANDNFAAAQLVVGETASVTGTSVDATEEAGEPDHYNHGGTRSTWYRWIAPSDGVLVVNTSANYSEVSAVYTGATVDGLTFVTSSHGDEMRVPVKAGVAYSIALDNCSGTGTHTVNLTFTGAPANDNFASPQVISGQEASSESVSARGASREGGEPARILRPRSVWYSWTAPWTGAAFIDTAESNFDTALAVYTGDSLGGLITVAKNDDASSSSRTSRVVFHATAGVTYRIAVDSGYYSSSYYSSGLGDVRVGVRMRELPPNDAFAAAETLPSAAEVTTTGRTDGATAETGEPSHHNFNPVRGSVWYRWTAPKDGALTIASNSNFGAALAVYRGTQVSGLTRVPNQAQPCNCAPAQVRVRVDAGRPTHRGRLADAVHGRRFRAVAFA